MPIVSKIFKEPYSKSEGGDGSKRISCDFNRPSDYRKASLNISKEAVRGLRIDFSVTAVREDNTQVAVLNSNNPVKDAFITDVQGYVDSLTWTIEHLEDDIQLPVSEFPDIFYMDDDIILKNKKMIEALEEVAMSWERHITKLIEMYCAKVRFLC